MFALSIVTAALVVPAVLAQDTSLGIQAIKAHFQQSGLDPDLFSSFEPTALITLNFPGAFPFFFSMASTYIEQQAWASCSQVNL